MAYRDRRIGVRAFRSPRKQGVDKVVRPKSHAVFGVRKVGDKWSKDYGGDNGDEIDGGIGHGNCPELAFSRRLGSLVDVLRVGGWVDGTK